MRKLLISTLLAGAAFAAQPAAFAAPVINPIPTLGNTPCALTDITPNALACVGWYEDNLNAGSPEKQAQTATALNALLGTSYTAATLPFLEDVIGPPSSSTIDFAAALFGETVIGIHAGGALGSNGIGYSGTAFFKFDAGNLPGGLDIIGFNKGGFSNARLFYTGKHTPPIPEPATWAMMLAGFGAVGYSMRRRQNLKVSFA